ncbi:MAG: RAMP superfamily CRISPR-associated protein [Coleofasciculus sp. B1-GNL1-01]|uniref:RAMP superfamily CRISPR-associated protein n=1 Tax=Coleofasciculus sp. B1-GNL1-01 TaxID=3068484 RepID=UPI003304F697
MIPNRPKKPQPPKPRPQKPKKKITGGRHQPPLGTEKTGTENPPPSPWLNPDCKPNPATDASFIEYLRWMREPDREYKDPTKVQILQMAQEGAKHYSARLTQLNKRTELIASQTFLVQCPWRIRVGGHRGPESILLPAFDALGMPYIPSSTLRGVTRNQAIRQVMAETGLDWKQVENHETIACYFGSLTPENQAHHAGKIVFLDAYPLPNQSELVAMDMANNIWTWDNHSPTYSPNPNPFLSLKAPTFLIGLRLASGCHDSQLLVQVQEWLIAGFGLGIGSQVNTGYGKLIHPETATPNHEFFRVKFTLEGQLIHGRQNFIPWKFHPRRQQWQMQGRADAEVRPVAFKSMLRYWFRTLVLGVSTPSQVQDWEAKLFGAINPKPQQGWLKVGLLKGQVTQREPHRNHNHGCGEQEGIFTLEFSQEAPTVQRQAFAETGESDLTNLGQSLTWLTFHLGSLGQGARRPCYSRTNPPLYRGSTFIPERRDEFWLLPDTIEEFQRLFQERLQRFYSALCQLFEAETINPQSLISAGYVSNHQWVEAVDANGKIVVVRGNKMSKKPYALEILLEFFHELETQKRYRDAKSLCGGVKTDKYKIGGQEFTRKATPSPIWIVDLGDYQVVTIFGATRNPRQEYLRRLQRECQQLLCLVNR